MAIYHFLSFIYSPINRPFPLSSPSLLAQLSTTPRVPVREGWLAIECLDPVGVSCFFLG